MLTTSNFYTGLQMLFEVAILDLAPSEGWVQDKSARVLGEERQAEG